MSTVGILMSAPYSAVNQQLDLIRYILITQMANLELYLISLRIPTYAVPALATLGNNDSLMDFAARHLGDYSQWSSVAALNGLSPPWTGAGGADNTAAGGQQLLLPSTGASISAGLPTPSYAVNVLGTDLYVGPINGSMPPWAGDYATITGYPNLQISLGRRLQTTLGDLIYHDDFGSRIPPEVGAVQDSATAGHINAYGDSAIQSDPRVAEVTSSQTIILSGGLGMVNYVANVQPIGYGALPLGLNEVINPQP
jgi:phage baseplate assembly protein W